MTLRDQGKPPSPPSPPPYAPPAAGCLRAPAAAGLAPSPGPQLPSLQAPANRLPVRWVPAAGGAMPACGGWPGTGGGLCTDAALEPGEELTPWLEGLPGDRELLQGHSHPEGDRCETLLLSGAAPSSSPRPTNSGVSFLLGSTGLMAFLHPPSSDGTSGWDILAPAVFSPSPEGRERVLRAPDLLLPC